VRCFDGCTATLRVLRGRELLARTIKHARPSRRRAARALIRLTHRGRQVLRAHRGRLRLALRATLREPSGRAIRRRAPVRLRSAAPG
jgi:hypothetical protein